ncbi:MAG: J domain-containing protein [bacterium]
MSINKKIKRIIRGKLNKLLSERPRINQKCSNIFTNNNNSKTKIDAYLDQKTCEAFKILELAPGATTDELTKAYRRLCKEYHPDRFCNNPEKQKYANELIIKINNAFNYLKKII